MKKIIAVLLLLAMLLTLVACSTEEEAESSSSTEETTTTPVQEVDQSEDDHHDHVHISYRGVSHRFDPEEMEKIEGKPCDYTSDANGTTLYIYNNVSFDDLYFTQIQYTFSDTTTRISCTYNVGSDLGEEERAAELAEIQSSYLAILSEVYGEGSVSEHSDGNTTVTWRDDLENYIYLTQINDTTLQVCFYLCAE